MFAKLLFSARKQHLGRGVREEEEEEEVFTEAAHGELFGDMLGCPECSRIWNLSGAQTCTVCLENLPFLREVRDAHGARTARPTDLSVTAGDRSKERWWVREQVTPQGISPGKLSPSSRSLVPLLTEKDRGNHCLLVGLGLTNNKTILLCAALSGSPIVPPSRQHPVFIP